MEMGEASGDWGIYLPSYDSGRAEQDSHAIGT